MKYLYSIIFLLVGCAASAQKIRFTDTSNKWAVKRASLLNPYICNQSSQRTFLGDTTIGGVFYQKLFDNSVTAFVREDTLQQIVYYRLHDVWNSGLDTSEQVLYNYNLQPGDSVVRNWDQASFTEHILELDSVLIGGVLHRVWRTNVSYTMEGIGDVRGPLFPPLPIFLDNCNYLNCFYTNGTQPLLSSYVEAFDNYNSCLLNTKNVSEKTTLANVSPNPVTSESRLIFPYNIKSGILIIYNCVGQGVARVAIEDRAEYRLGKLIGVHGMYYFILTDEGTQTSYRGKFRD